MRCAALWGVKQVPTPNPSRKRDGGENSVPSRRWGSGKSSIPARLREGSETCRALARLVAAGWALA